MGNKKNNKFTICDKTDGISTKDERSIFIKDARRAELSLNRGMFNSSSPRIIMPSPTIPQKIQDMVDTDGSAAKQIELPEENQEITTRPQRRESDSGFKLKLKQGSDNVVPARGPSEKRTRNKEKTKFFYTVQDHNALYHIGKSYFQDFHQGIRNFAFTSTASEQAQENTMLALASYFEHQIDISIALIMDSFHTVQIQRLINASEQIPQGPDNNVDIFRHNDNLDFIDINSIGDLYHGVNDSDHYNNKIKQIIAPYDLVLWGLPTIDKMKSTSELFFPISLQIESVSIIVSKTKCKFTDIDNTKQFFRQYGIPIKGALFEQS